MIFKIRFTGKLGSELAVIINEPTTH